MNSTTPLSSDPQETLLQRRRLIPLLVTAGVGVLIWFLPPPRGVTDQAWHLLAIFAATITGIITRPLPMGAVALVGIVLTVLLGVLSIDEALSGFSNSTIWLIVIAFLIARGFIKTGLSTRIGYGFVALLGHKTLGLGYGLIATDLVLAPAIPSNTARAGGVVFPIFRSLARAYDSDPEEGTSRRIGAFLAKTAFQGTLITSAMFLTAMAANPLAAQLAADLGVVITWTDWALAAAVPGLTSLVVVPLLLYLLYPPEIRETPRAASLAQEKLKALGPVRVGEGIMLTAFILLLVLWIFGPSLEIHSTTAALVGLSLLLLSGVLTWKDVCREHEAWNTLVWFSALVMMANYLNELGFIPWFSGVVGGSMQGLHWIPAFLGLSLAYFYSHYLFASNTAHVSSMYAPFLAVALAVGTPPLLAALTLGFFSNLFSGTTHYGTGPAPIFFGASYVELGDWWKLGALLSVVNILIWLLVGGLWWKFLGLW